MRGQSWSSGISIAKREGSEITGLRPQQRPYRADADMTAVVELMDQSPVTAEELLAALDRPKHPLFIGRSSCPPATRIAGTAVEAGPLEAVVLAIARSNPGDIYLPIEAATPSWGDMPVSIPGSRDWASYRHSGTDRYIVRTLSRPGRG
jgi:CRISPR system Cascade subunit CasD